MENKKRRRAFHASRPGAARCSNVRDRSGPPVELDGAPPLGKPAFARTGGAAGPHDFVTCRRRRGGNLPAAPLFGTYQPEKGTSKMRRKFAMALLSVFVLTGAATILSACNTTEGAGEDMSAAGNAVSNSAQRAKPYR
jgi:entericidin B